MYGRQTLVISIPTILAWLSFGKRISIPFLPIVLFLFNGCWLSFIGTSLAMIAALVAPSGTPKVPGAATNWSFSISIAAYSTALGVNAIIATLLAIRIYQNQKIAKETLTVKKRSVHPIRRMISIFNDSGMLMLGCQIIWLTFFRLNSIGFILIKGPIVMIYVSWNRDVFLPFSPPYTPLPRFLLLNKYIYSFFYIGIDANYDLPTSSATIGSSFFRGETEKRPLYLGTLCNLKKVKVGDINTFFFFHQNL